MTWEVEVSDEFIEWYGSLDENESISVDTAVDKIGIDGPTLDGLMPIRSKAQGTQT